MMLDSIKLMSPVLSKKNMIEIMIDLKNKLLLITFNMADFIIFSTLKAPSYISNMLMHLLFDFTSSPIKSKQAILSSSYKY